MQFKQISAVIVQPLIGAERVFIYALSEEGQMYVAENVIPGRGKNVVWEEVKHPKDK